MTDTPAGPAALDGDAIRRWLGVAVRLLEQLREEIDDLNVYPVPDGDTGTNMLHTVRGAHEALAEAESGGDLLGVVRTAARGALLGARGNSGVILSQVFRGVSEAVEAHGALDGRGVADAFRRAADRSYEAVAKPVEGTILTVARAAADRALAASETSQDTTTQPSDHLAYVVSEAVAAASEALARTPTMLPALARAGVVDAGGRGLEVVYLALQSAVAGTEVEVAPVERTARTSDVLTAAREAGSDEFEYEVMYLLHAEDDPVAELRSELAGLGDSVVVTGTGDGLWSIHVHVNDIGAAIEAGVETGRVTRITVTRFSDQYEQKAEPGVSPRPKPGRAVVAVALGAGVEDAFRSEGAVVVAGGATFNPSTAELLEAIHRSGVDHVVILPNEGNVVGVARAAARLARDEGIQAVVVPTRATVQGIAALLARDPDRSFEGDVAAMSDAAQACTWGEVTTAVRAAVTDAGPVRGGDVLGLHEGRVVEIGPNLTGVTTALLGRMITDESELLTLVTGEDVAEALVDAVTEYVEARWPEVEVQALAGGQPHYPLVLGVE